MKARGRPTQMFGRFYYETGRGEATTGAGGSVIPAAAAWEAIAIVASSPCLLTCAEMVLSDAAADGTDYWVLAYDVNANSADVAAAIANGSIGAARYTWGPFNAPGGTIVREPGELFELVGDCERQRTSGAPFDLGCVLVLSLTPRVVTLSPDDLLAVTARGSLL